MVINIDIVCFDADAYNNMQRWYCLAIVLGVPVPIMKSIFTVTGGGSIVYRRVDEDGQ